MSRQCRLWSFFQCALDLRGSVGFFCRGILRLSSPFEYDVILTFVRAHEELVYFIRSQSPKTAVIPRLYLIAFVDLVPIATEKVSRIRSNIIWNRWKGKIHKSEPEPGNANVNTAYFVNQARGNIRISRTEFVYVMNEHLIANVYSVIFELPS